MEELPPDITIGLSGRYRSTCGRDVGHIQHPARTSRGRPTGGYPPRMHDPEVPGTPLPSSKTAGPLRWGVLAPTAMIARLAVIPALVASDTADLVAFASTSSGPSELDVAGLRDGVPWYRDYADLLADERVDAVYVPLPNSMHREWVEVCLAAGKHVLCEKPLAVSASDATAMAEAAAKSGRVLLEAYMTPYHPRSQAIATVIANAELGEPRLAHSVFAGTLGRPGNHRWDPSMGGGVLYDLGIYCIAPLLAFGGDEPVAVAATAVLSAGANRATSGGGVDTSFAGLMRFENGLLASFECSFEGAERQRLELVGSAASLSAERAFTPGGDQSCYQWSDVGGATEDRYTGGGEIYLPMVEEFASVVAGSRAARHPLSSTIAIARTVDRLRSAAGLE